MPHDQLRFDLVDGIHGHTHHDQKRGAAKVEVDPQTVRGPGRQALEEAADEPHLVEANARDQEGGHQRNDDQIAWRRPA